MIWEELDNKIIFNSLDVSSSKDVFEKLGGTLIQEGYAKDTYIDALNAREADFPTGLDINGIGVAIPHTDASHINKPGIAIARLNKPVQFIQMGTDDEPVDVQLVFMLSVKDPGAHIGRLQRIIEIIQDTSVLKKLMKAKKNEDIINIIKTKEDKIEEAQSLELAGNLA